MSALTRSIRLTAAALVVAGCVASAAATPATAAKGSGTSVTLRPAQTTADLANPGRGQYLWHPDEHPATVASTVAGVDSYARYFWRQLEPTEGAYDFSEIERQLAAAAARGGTFSFRVMPVCQGCDGTTIVDALPADLSGLSSTWTARFADGTGVRVPDWNDPTYLARWASLMTALGAAYDRDPRLGYIDVGGYGNWGEAHNWPYEGQYPGPGGQAEATPATLHAISAAVTRAFPGHFIAYVPPIVKDGTGARSMPLEWSTLKSVLGSSAKVGLRNDCLGGGTVQQSQVDLLTYAQAQAVAENVPLTSRPLERWRIAPFVTEWCPNIAPGSTDGTFAKGRAQVASWHVSAVSNANFSGPISAYSAAERAEFSAAAAAAGYRIGVREAVLTQTAPGASLVVKATWQNTGNAPTYTPWRVSYLLRDAAGTPRATLTSALSLTVLLGGGATVTDQVTLPKVAPGSYGLEVSVTDPAAYLRPLRLTTGVQGPSGTHKIGTVTVR